MISASYINRLLKDYLKTSRGKEVIAKSKHGAAGGSQIKIGGASGLDINKINEYGNLMRTILIDEFNKVVLHGQSRIDESDFEVVLLESGGEYKVSIVPKDSDTLARKSLNPSSSGIRNLFLLFSEGWETENNTPSGIWTGHGVKIKGLPSREASNFLKRAIERFNNQSKEKCRAYLTGQYEKYGL